MSQRITGLASAVAAIGSLFACGLLWQILQELKTERREVAVAEQPAGEEESASRESASQVESRDKRNGDSDTKSDWQPLRVQVLDANGDPVQASVRVSGQTFAGGKLYQKAEPNEEGLADFGLLPPGQYSLRYSLDDPLLASSRDVLIGPGRPTEYDVVFPTGPVGEFDLKFDVETPDNLDDVPLYYFAEIDFESRTVDGEEWSVSGAKGEDWVLLIDSDGTILGKTDYGKVTERERVSGNSYSVSYLDELPADFEFEPVDSLPAYGFSVEFWPFVKDREKSGDSAGERPPLRRLIMAALRGQPRQHPTPGETFTVSLDASEEQFWEKVQENLNRLDGIVEGEDADIETTPGE